MSFIISNQKIATGKRGDDSVMKPPVVLFPCSAGYEPGSEFQNFLAENRGRYELRNYEKMPGQFSRFMLAALQESLKSSCHPRHGAVITDRHEDIWVSGYNGENRGNSVFRRYYNLIYGDYTLHAEFAALVKIPCDNVLKILRLRTGVEILRGARIYSYRVTKQGFPANSRPCRDICWPMFKDLGFRDAVYIFKIGDEPFFAYEVF